MITFTLLSTSHFPLLLKWLNEPHVKTWWDQDVSWTSELIEEKHASYVNGYKIENREPKPIHAYIIEYDQLPIGYIQYYSAYDFPRVPPLVDLPHSLGAFDMFIGAPHMTGRGIGSSALIQFTDQHIFSQYEYAFTDPECTNEQAVRAYTKAGFVIFKHVQNVLWMMKEARE